MKSSIDEADLAVVGKSLRQRAKNLFNQSDAYCVGPDCPTKRS